MEDEPKITVGQRIVLNSRVISEIMGRYDNVMYAKPIRALSYSDWADLVDLVLGMTMDAGFELRPCYFELNDFCGNLAINVARLSFIKEDAEGTPAGNSFYVTVMLQILGGFAQWTILGSKDIGGLKAGFTQLRESVHRNIMRKCHDLVMSISGQAPAGVRPSLWKSLFG